MFILFEFGLCLLSNLDFEMMYGKIKDEEIR